MARKYLGYGVDEWDRLPAWQTEMYKGQIQEEHDAKSGKKPAHSDPGLAINTDYAVDAPLPPGFQTRRAG